MTYNVKCPLCGTENKNLYLDETNGWFECECCKRESRFDYNCIKPIFGGSLLRTFADFSQK